ncbi:MAG: F0F1 ATP synthase subunit A [Candidatus Eisenbacteria bacterium]|nr:F0F1 ATP synthase subunit A [Candidatus Eisenbacteria bacterium]
MSGHGAAGAAEETVQQAGHAEQAAQGAGHAAEHFDFVHVFHHLQDQVLVPLPTFHVGGVAVDLSITKAVLMMWIAGALALGFFVLIARRLRRSDVPRGTFVNLLESMVLFVRDDMVYDVMGKKAGRRYTPYFLSLFFFILFCNILGLVPFMATATANIAVTGGLALLSFLVIQTSGIREQGAGEYIRNIVPPGMPIFLLPIMIPIEIVGHFIKPFALTIRLFANMTAGHVVILSLFGLIFLFRAVAVAVPAVAFVLFIDALELFVAFLQAYIFTFLTVLFVNMAIHPEH